MLKYQIRFQCYGYDKDIYGKKLKGRYVDIVKNFKNVETARRFLSKIRKFIVKNQTKYCPVSEREVNFVKKFIDNGYIKECYGLFKVIEERID